MAGIFVALLATYFWVVYSQCNIILDSCLLEADCGERGLTTTVSDLDDVESFDACSTFYGSLYLLTGTDTEYDNITMPESLVAITGALYCGGRGNDTTTDSINARHLVTTGTDVTDPTIGRVGFVIVDYPTLSSLSFPDLAAVGPDFIIARNPKLTTIEFPTLKSVSGNLDITGNFEVLELPSLSLVNGSVNLQTTFPTFNCPLFGNVVILGAYTCSVGVNNPQPLLADDSSTNPTPVNAIAAGIANSSSSFISPVFISAPISAPISVSASVSASVSISVAITAVTTSPSQTSSFSSISPSSSPTAAKSSASFTEISFTFLKIGFIAVCFQLCFGFD
jgi:hypothetical protein